MGLPIQEEGVLRIFIALKNPSPWPGYEPATFGSSGKHTNHYTTKETIVRCYETKTMSTYVILIYIIFLFLYCSGLYMLYYFY
jgi:hypothetical protein